MPKLRTLSGSEVLGILAEGSSRSRSEAVISRFVESPGRAKLQTLTIPNHKEIEVRYRDIPAGMPFRGGIRTPPKVFAN